MTFNQLLTRKFHVKQRRIVKIYEKNIKNKKTIDSILQFNVFVIGTLSIFSPVMFLDLGIYNFFICIIILFSSCALLNFFIKNPFNKVINLNKKFKLNKYNKILNNNQYSIIYEKIKNCKFEEFKENKKIIFNYIKELPEQDNGSIIELINRKIDLHDNGLKKIEERINNISSSKSIQENKKQHLISI